MTGSLHTAPTSRSRTAAFLVLAAAAVFSLLWLKPQPFAPREHELAELYCRGGDTFVRCYYLANAKRMSDLTAEGFLRRARDYYRLARVADPRSPRAAISLGLVLRAMGRQEAGTAMVFRALRRGTFPSQQASAIRAVLVLRRPDQASVNAAKQALGDSGPLPLFFADAYRRMGRADLAEQETRRIEEQGLAVLPRLIGIFAMLALIVVCHAVALLAGGIALAKRPPRRPRTPAPAPPEAVWGAREAVEAVIILISGQVFVGLLAAAACGSRGSARVVTQALATVLGALCAVAWVRLSVRLRSRQASPRGAGLGWCLARWWRQAAVGVVVAGVAVLPLIGLQQVLVWLLGDGPAHDPIKGLLVSPPAWLSRAAIILLVCVVVPVLEETMFRGVLYRALRRQWSFLPSALGSGLVFAAGHLTPAVFPPMLILGILLAYLYERSGSLLVPAAVHSAVNAFSLATMLALFG